MERANSRIRIFMVILVFIPVSICAQNHSISPGDTVRVTYTNVVTSRTVGILEDISADSLYLNRQDTTLALALLTVRRVEMSVGRRTLEGRGAAIGAVTGGLLLGVLMVASDGSSGSNSDTGGLDFELFSPGEAFAAGFVIGAAGGAFAGLIIGGLTETHRWEKVPLELGVEPISLRLAKRPNSYGFTVRWNF